MPAFTQPLCLFALAGLAFGSTACDDQHNGPAGEQAAAAAQARPGPPQNADLSSQSQRPVRIGREGPDFAACDGYARVSGLPDLSGDDLLAVHSAPSVKARVVDRIGMGLTVSLCEHATGFIGIVYPARGTDVAQCGTGSPVSEEQDYSGPCRSGWVSEELITAIAG